MSKNQNNLPVDLKIKIEDDKLLKYTRYIDSGIFINEEKFERLGLESKPGLPQPLPAFLHELRAHIGMVSDDPRLTEHLEPKRFHEIIGELYNDLKNYKTVELEVNGEKISGKDYKKSEMDQILRAVLEKVTSKTRLDEQGNKVVTPRDFGLNLDQIGAKPGAEIKLSQAAQEVIASIKGAAK